MNKYLILIASSLFCLLNGSSAIHEQQAKITLFFDYLLEERPIDDQAPEIFNDSHQMLQLRNFDVRLFPQVMKLGSLYTPSFKQKEPSCSVKDSVAAFIRIYIQQYRDWSDDDCHRLLRVIKYAYTKQPIIIDCYMTEDRSETLGSFLDSHSNDVRINQLLKSCSFIRYEALIDLLDSCMVGKTDVEAFKKALKGNDKEFLSMPLHLFGITVGQVLAVTRAHFPRAEKVLSALDSQWSETYKPVPVPLDQWKMGLAQICCTAVTSEKKIPYAMLKHLVKQTKFCADDVALPSAYSANDDDTDDEKGVLSLGAFIDTNKHLSKVARLDSILKPYRIDGEKLGRLIEQCLWGKAPLRELQNFVAGHNGPLLLTMKFSFGENSGKSIISVLLEKNPALFKTAPEIIKLLDPQTDYKGPYAAMRAAQRIKAAEEEIALWMHSYITKGTPTFDRLVYGYTAQPFCIDYGTICQTQKNLGAFVDRQKNTERGAKVAALVRRLRVLSLSNDTDHSGLRNLIVTCLTSNQSALDRARDYAARAGTPLDDISLAGEVSPVLGISEFFKKLNPQIFLNKQPAADAFNLTRERVSGAYSKETDKKCIEELLVLSIMYKEFRPLVAYGYRNYQKVYGAYGEKDAIKLTNIFYKGQTVAQYLTKKTSAGDRDFYENVVCLGSSEKNTSKQLEKKPSVPVWRKGVISVLVGAGLYAGYRWFRSGKSSVVTQVA